ncbi:Protocatechuate 4,5-dioxygenase alpha chain [compost metagenome]
MLKRDWLGMLRVGGNIYYTIKIAFCDGLTFQDVAGMMCGMPKEEYAKMMLAGGRVPTADNLHKAGSPREKK